jgi:predicted RND superfamily exporter protein/CRP-like cAMP-binding protein
MERVARAIAGHPRLVLAAVAAVTLVSLTQLIDLRSGALRLHLDASLDRLLPRGDAELAFETRTRRLFGQRDALLVGLVADDVFSPAALRALARMTERMGRLQGVHHVVSLANAPRMHSAGDDIWIEPFLAEIPTDPAALAALRSEALDHPLYGGTLVSGDGRVAMILVYLGESRSRGPAASELAGRLEAIAAEEARTAGVDAWVTGLPYVKAAVSRALLEDLERLLPLSLLAVAVVAWIAFRSWRGVWIPGATVVLAVIWTVGAVAAGGHPLNLVTTLVPILVIAVGFSYAVHLVSEYFELARRDEWGPPQAAAEALARVALPVFLTALTTAVGFVSLSVSRLPAVRAFGLFSVLGVTAALLATLTFTPAVLALLRAPPPRPHRESRFDAIAARTARFDLEHRRAILVAGAFATLIALVGMTRIHMGTDVIANFDPDSPIRRHLDALGEHFGGVSSFDVVLESESPGSFQEPAQLREIRSLQSWLQAQPEVARTASFVDYLMLLHRAFQGGDPAQFSIPESRALVAQLLFFGGGEAIEGFVDNRFQRTRVAVRTRAMNSAETAALVARVEERLETRLPNLHPTVTGQSILATRTLNEVARGQVLSLGVAFAGILAILVALFTSLRVGLTALIPNALPVAAYFGLLGLSGITLNATTGLVACMVLGIAVDDTIHFLVRFNELAKRFADERRGAIEALRAVGRPITYTSAALCLGLLVLALSSLRNQVEFGVLAAATLAFAWLVDVLLTPALTSGMRIVTLWDVLTLDLGEAPERSIPVFHGLGRRQARLVALMTRLRSLPAGQPLLREGETGEEIYVVIDGELALSSRDGGGRAVRIGTVHRGDVVGEVALFRGRRTADVDTLTEVRVLEFTLRDLERQLLRRYPRIGRQFYRNLSAVIASRMTPLARDQRMRLMRFVCSFAWADHAIQPEERTFVARLMRRLELDVGEQRQVEAWLREPPEPVDPAEVPPEHRLLFVESVAALLLADGEIAPEELELFGPLVDGPRRPV